MNYKAILFDLDDTLCDTSKSKDLVFSRIYDDTPKLQTVGKRRFINTASQERYKYLKRANGEQTYARIEMWLSIVSKLNLNFSLKELKYLIDFYWKYSLSELSLYPQAREVLSKILRSGIVTAILASGDFYSKASKLTRLRIDNFFRYVFTSDLVDIPKNDPAIYKYVADYLNIKGSEILMVGDNPMTDIMPANQAGYQTAQVHLSERHRIRKSGPTKPTHPIYKLNDLLYIIGIT